jgi:cob(I)alamin adenosyltransferase
MVRLTRIYTGGGDKGETSLGNGKRVPKHDLRVAAYGTVDEANAVIGVARAEMRRQPPGDEKRSGTVDAMLARVQNDLFDLGADLCTPEESRKGGEALRISGGQAKRLEGEIDAVNGALEPLTSFVLPGGALAAAHLHHARTVARRAERLVARLAEIETVNAEVIVYLNRLSDLLFVLARHCNEDGKADVLWTPGENR